MNAKAKITAVERASAELNELVSGTITELADRTKLSSGAEAQLRTDIDEIVMAAQHVIVARLKAKAYEVYDGYANSGEDDTPELDAWDDAVQVADPAGYDVMWKREWKA
jgi:hypothetical protein